MTEAICQKCGKAFGYEHTGNVYPGGKEKETIDCPYCGTMYDSIMTSGIVRSYKLDENGNKIY